MKNKSISKNKKEKTSPKKTTQNKKQSKTKKQCSLDFTIEENNINPTMPIDKNEERFYCRNANLIKEMLKWKNSTTQGIPVLKKVKGKLVETEKTQDDYKHEKYKDGTEYYIRYSKTNERYTLIMEKPEKYSFMTNRNGDIVENVTEKVKGMGYAFDIDDNEQHRTFSEVFGMMLIIMGKKVSNHSFFRNYTNELKQDMQAYGYEKVIRGLPNYNFKYDNAFAYLTSAFFNSFKSILSKHYKQVNIKRDLTKKAMINLQSEVPGSSMEKCLGNQFRGNDFDDFSEF